MAATSSARGLRAIVRSRARDWSHTLTPLHVFGGHPLLDAEIPTSAVTGRPLHLSLDIDLSDARLQDLGLSSVRRLAILSNQHQEASTEPIFLRHLDGGRRVEILGEPTTRPTPGVLDALPQLPVDLEPLSDAEMAVETVDELPDGKRPIHQVGGHPVWAVKPQSPPRCPISGKPMRFVAAVDSVKRFPLADGDVSLRFGDGGIFYVYWCDETSVSAGFTQSA